MGKQFLMVKAPRSFKMTGTTCPLTQHYITRTWIFQVFAVTFRVLRVVPVGYTFVWSDVFYAGRTHCHKVEQYVTCQKLHGMGVACCHPQAKPSIVLVTIFPAQPDHLTWIWKQHQVSPKYQYSQLAWSHILVQLTCAISDDHTDPASWLVIVYGKCNEILNPPSYISQITHTFNCILHSYQLGGVFHFEGDTVQRGQYRQFSHNALFHSTVLLLNRYL